MNARSSCGLKHPIGLTLFERAVKRTFDIVVAIVGLMLTWWLIILAFVVSCVDTGKSGFFSQTRVGRDGSLFHIVKIRTMRDIPAYETTVTQSSDPRITKIGRFFRKAKIDELPQLINVLLGHMSVVGPRPDVPGFADQLSGDDRLILTVRPGITGPATLRFRDEEDILANQPDPETYNREVIFLEKTRLNREYVENYSFLGDLRYIFETVFNR
jgi:lipopolysaccharide/colanic/teichoic acid biosynthesis glycosyltransferase